MCVLLGVSVGMCVSMYFLNSCQFAFLKLVYVWLVRVGLGCISWIFVNMGKWSELPCVSVSHVAVWM